ncbi:uncharacterized protein NECHADRAFT_83086 [Fusarium vanettenii 77-13-4]|uniref:Uncharacterized protein n=1 Tax=Fusarium vanettenii (strain ATCC MYA-4622 / CBS 123669 / FGSC 9596 / NRRL 45880 / 77-13-4) TaxID=660122 RepID=C7ZBB3_FUSV7|nr:uncharacterized protein NECHADRAFT_83086 [Fusarium vanettenii 77-13-4]EEU38814.1 predicted protein [Fusarium vanettenii 77-13-4]
MKPSLPTIIHFRQDSILNKGTLKEALSEIFGSTYWTLTEGPHTFYVEAANEPNVDVVSALEAAGAIQMRSVDEPSAIMDEDRTESKETKTEVEKKPVKKAKKKKRAEVKSKEKSVRKSYNVADEKSTDEPVRAICNVNKPRKPTEGVGRAMAMPPN